MFSDKGSLKDISVIKLLLTFFEQALTGVLYFNNEEVQKVLYLSRGRLIWAMSDSDEDKLENILISRKLVDLGILNTFKSEVQVSESIGKLLVERGLITLEELIESSKAQLKKIVLGILRWKEGRYQLIQNAPPEKLLLNLDLSITDFIIGFILEEVDISDIMNEIGSLQIEFVKNPDEQKVARYNLSNKQMEFLNSFTGEYNLESILSRYSGGHHESLLKIIYFFLMAGLLIKKEVELSDSPVVEEEPKSDLIVKDISDTDLEFTRPDISDTDLEFARPDALDSDFESEKPTTSDIDTDIDVDSVKRSISDTDLEFARPDALDSDFESDEPITPDIDTDSDADSVKPDISDSDLELVEQDISDTRIDFDSVEQDISESDFGSVEPDISKSEVELDRREISDTDVDSVEPDISDKDVDLVEPDISDADVDSVESDVSDTDVDSVGSEVSATDVDSVEVKRDTSDTTFDTVQKDISGTSFASYKFTDSDTERKLMDLFGSEAKAAQLKEKAISVESAPSPSPPPPPSPSPILERKEKEKPREGKKIKLLSLILVILILVIGGIILLLLPVLKDDTPTPGVMKTTKKGEVITVDVDERKPVVQKGKSQGEKPEEIKIEKVGKKTVADKKVEKKKKEDQSKLIPGKSAMAYFREGNLITAGNIWRQEMRKSGIKFTILLEMDCLIESVMNAYERIEAKENFFILNRKVGARSCFLVMYGKFYTQQAAAEGIKQIPQYFWQQQSPPRVVELYRYL